MCGICGVLWAEDKELVGRMQEVLKHRGPDDSGVYSDKDVTLGHRRLSIIDLSTKGHQPMGNEDGSVWIVFNGEIYNYKELKPDLEKKGHKFKSNTDTEVIIHLYEEYGKDAVKKLRGMFAFAIWDSKRKALFLARDRLGKKPVYYTTVNGRFMFASEIKALLEDHEVERKVSLKGLNAYTLHQYVPAPLTMFEGIFKLNAGHHMTVKKEGVKVEKYWDVNLEVENKTESQCVSEVRRLLEESVRIRLMSDVPLGIFLSGGLDSSAIVSMASKQGKEKVKTISVGFEWQGLDEREYSRIVAKAFNTEHTEIVIRGDAMKSFPDMVWHLDEPVADYAIIPTYLMSKEARKHATVYLTGDGGDELYGGYTKYRWVRKREFLVKAPGVKGLMRAAVRNKVTGGVLDRMAASGDVKDVVESAGDIKSTYIRGSRVLSEDTKKDVLSERVFDSNPYDETIKPLVDCTVDSSSSDFLNKILYLDVKTWLAEDFLMKVDKSSMAHSLEARNPYLDHVLVENAFTIPSEMKVSLGGREKMILRKAVKDILPERIVGRRKQGFEIPGDEWLKRELRAGIDQVPKFLKRTSFFKEEKAMRMLEYYASSEKTKDKKYETSRRLWALLYPFKLWHEIFIDNGGRRTR